MAVMIEDVTMAKSQKSLRVKLGGTWYGAYLDSGLNAPALKGTMIEAEITTLEKGGPWIKKWVASAAPVLQSQAPITREPVQEPKYAEPVKPGTVAPYWLPMASNVVAHAIAAGKIETPVAIKTWVQAVKNAVENADDLPF